jgi:deoxyribose-phosphate aldolase
MKPMPNTKEVAAMIDHAVLQPMATIDELRHACALSLSWEVASLCVKPCDVSTAYTLLANSPVKTSTVVGFPHGSSTTNSKYQEARQALDEGASELDMVVNIGRVLGGDWLYVKHEISLINQLCVNNNALLKVIFENDFLPTDSIKIRLVELCRDAGVAFIKTSTGYGYVRQPGGQFATSGATIHDCALMVEHAGPSTRVKAAGGIRSAADLLALWNVGVTRFGTTATAAILAELAGLSPTGGQEPGY